jgi:hypothetical protein
MLVLVDQQVPVVIGGSHLNTETGEISPDRGNHAIGVTAAGPTLQMTPRSVRYCSATWPAYG